MITDYLTDHKRLYYELDLRPMIEIYGKVYKELRNISYELSYNEDILASDAKPDKEEDIDERNYLVSKLDDCIRELDFESGSRRAAFCNEHHNIGMAKCITTVHFFVRNGEVHLNEYYRSQHATKNFQYDYITACIMMEIMIRKLKLKPGIITVFVANFHKEVK